MYTPASRRRNGAGRSLSVRRAGLLLGTGLALAACGSPTQGELDTFAGEWCTLRGLGNDNLPVPGIPYVGMTMIEQADGRLLGTGSTSPPDTDSIFPASYRGDVQPSGRGLVEVGDLDAATEAPGPQFTMDLAKDGVRDLVGTLSGDRGFVGTIHLVRLGPRCFVE